jgi:hypothetical protein
VPLQSSEGDVQKFQAYVRALALPADQWPKAFETLQKISGVESGPEYRLQSALDFFLQGCQAENVFVRFVLMVIVAERLFSKREHNKRRRIARGIYTFTKEIDPNQIESDYNTRNDLVHGPEDLHEPQKVAELAARWESACGAVLSKILTEGRVVELQTLLDEQLSGSVS